MTKEELDVLYTNNLGKRSFQWELWSVCNNICDFCYLGKDNRHTDKARQMKSLNDCWEAIHNLDFDKYNNISFIGGEFFQGQLVDKEVHDRFMEVMSYVADLYMEKKLGSIWIAATLTIGEQEDLYEMLDMFFSKGVKPLEEYGASGLWICTSWDAKGRFHTKKTQENWEFHMKNMHEKYPYLKFNTCCILQEAFLQDYIDGKWSPKKFMEEFHTSLFYKQPSAGCLPEHEWLAQGTDYYSCHLNAKKYLNDKMGYNFMPRREVFVKFLRKYAIEDRDTFDRLFNIKYRADELHRNLNDNDNEQLYNRIKNSEQESDGNGSLYNKCGHLMDYAPYVGSDRCVICDRNTILASLED